MRQPFILFLVCGNCFFASQFLLDRSAKGHEPGRITPASGGVELEEINIVRRTALGAVAGADLTNMELKLYFPAVWTRQERVENANYLIHFESLTNIEDDTGKLLSTEGRLKEIQYLRGDVQGDELKGGGRAGGPIARLLLEAPARKAEKIKAIKGKAQISLAKTVNLTFKDLAAINGKLLEHTDLKGLQHLKLRFSIQEKDGNVIATVTAPAKYTSPWNLGRLHHWDLFKGEQEIELSSEAVLPDNQGIAVEKRYARPSFKGLSLRLVVLDPVESKTFNFDFRNVDLP